LIFDSPASPRSASICAGIIATPTLLYNEALGVFDTSTYLQPQALDPAYSGFVELGMMMEATEWLNVSLTINSGEIRYRTRSFDGTTTLSSEWTSNGRLVADEASQSLFIREVLLDVHDPDTGWWQVRAGRRLWRVAQSLIYDDFGLGAGVNFDLNLKQGTPLRFEAAYVIPTRDFQPLPLASPLLTAKVDYVLSLFESVSLGGAFFFDGAGELGETFRQGFVESILTLPNLRRVPARRAAFETARQRSLITALQPTHRLQHAPCLRFCITQQNAWTRHAACDSRGFGRKNLAMHRASHLRLYRRQSHVRHSHPATHTVGLGF
jgi:hypothetical protein